uniref:FYVE-type domain-containing protein n=2 Tax=Mesocestoides corti TaxID=53468 RepID=A0A5K3F138_MESCO
MSELTEGFLCPECMLNLASDEALMAHFEENHIEKPPTNHHVVEATSTRPLLPPSPVNDLLADYRRLASDYADNIQALTKAKNQLQSKTMLLENLLLSIASGTLTPENLHNLDNSLRQNLTDYLNSEAERATQNAALVLQITEQRDVALSDVNKLKDQLFLANERATNLELDLETKTRLIAELESKLQKSQQDLPAKDANAPQSLLDGETRSCETSQEAGENSKDTIVTNAATLHQAQRELEAAVRKRYDLLEKLNELQSQMLREGTSDQLESQLGQIKDELNSFNSERCALDDIQALPMAKESSHPETVQPYATKFASEKNQLSAEVLALKKQVSDLTEYTDSLNETIRTLEGNRTELTEMLASRDKEVTRLKVEYEAEIVSIKTTMAERLAKSANALNQLKAEKIASAEEVSDLTHQLQECETKLRDAEGALGSAEADRGVLERTLVELRSHLEKKDALIEVLNKHMEERTNEMEAKSSECQQLTEQVQSLTLEHTAVVATNESLTARLAEADASIGRLTSSEALLLQNVQELTDKLTLLRSQQESHARAMAEMQSKIDSTQSEHQTLMDRFIECQDKANQLELALQTCTRELESLQRIVLDLGRQNQALQISLERQTNRQWVSDESATCCSNCQKEFSISFRKHHCRHCGKVFCQACSSKKTATSASKDPLRVCDACFAELTGVR